MEVQLLPSSIILFVKAFSLEVTHFNRKKHQIQCQSVAQPVRDKGEECEQFVKNREKEGENQCTYNKNSEALKTTRPLKSIYVNMLDCRIV